MSLVSLYDEASLWMTPSTAKDGKLFSELPTDGSGDFTFSRGSNLAATRVGPTGLIEKGRENLLLQSNQFDTTWDYTNNTLVSGQSGYDGSNNAWFVTKIPASYVPLVQSVSVSGVNTFSFYAKAGTAAFVRTYIPSGNWIINFDFASGNATNQATTNGLVSYSMTSVGNGWYRCSSTHSGSITEVRIYNEWAETNASTYYIQDAQLEIGLAATDYIESGATTGKAGLLEDEPRFDYSGGATCPSLLLEGSRTNLLPYSEYFEGYSNAGATFTTNSIASPEGVVNATTFEGDGTLTYIRLAHSITFSSAGDYTISVFAKSGNNDFMYMYPEGFTGSSGVLQAYFDLSNGTTPTSGASIEPVGTDGWYRCSITATIDAGDLGGNIVLLNTPSTSGVFFPTAGDANGKGVEIYGFQVEQGSYPTSYIPNHSGGTVTRVADNTGAIDVSSLGVTTGYTLFYELGDFNVAVGGVWLTQSGGGDRPYQVYGATAVIKTNSGDAYPFNHGTLGKGTGIKVAVNYDGTNINVFTNGTKRGTWAANKTIWDTLTNLDMNLSSVQMVNWKQLLVFPTALTDSECIKLTTI